MVSYLILASGRLLQKSADQYYPFRVDSDFLAWTGMDIE